MYFSHFYNDKLYLFYRRSKTPFLRIDYRKTLDDVYLLTICCKSFRVLKNRRLSAENIKVNHGILKKIRFKNFEKIFYYEKLEKLFIRTDCIELCDHVLVFDLKSDFLYFDKSSIMSSTRLHFATCRDGTIHGVGYKHCKNLDLFCSEIRSFKFEKELLVKEGIKWRNVEDIDFAPYVTSAFYV